MIGEANFHLNGFVNKQNCRFWGLENPRAIHQRELHPLKCTVWCGVTSGRIIGPYFFENEDSSATTVTSERYRAMLENFVRPAVKDKPEMWFQQNRATCPHGMSHGGASKANFWTPNNFAKFRNLLAITFS